MCENKIDKKELYKIAIDTRNFEIGLFWQRSNYFLVLNTAIAVGFFSLEGKCYYQAALSVFGVLVSILWFRVNLGSKYWQSRWEQRASILEGELTGDIDLFSAEKEITDKDVKESLTHNGKNKLTCYDEWVLDKPSVSKSMSMLAALFIFTWSFILLVLIYTWLTP